MHHLLLSSALLWAYNIFSGSLFLSTWGMNLKMFRPFIFNHCPSVFHFILFRSSYLFLLPGVAGQWAQAGDWLSRLDAIMSGKLQAMPSGSTWTLFSAASMLSQGTGHQGYLTLKTVAVLNGKSSRKTLCLYLSHIFSTAPNSSFTVTR